ncbi:MAG: DUF5627 domain-containing protein [Bacteroidaceae bacterium]|nr:DUF5627 domain-containing protein [Bacteroidaceae bacterium]
MNSLKLLSVLSIGLLAISCENQDADYPDYEGGTTVSFAYQYPVRTIVLGEDTYDTTLDNQHECTIYGAMGGSYKGKNIIVDFNVDNALTDHLYFSDGSAVQAMPSTYYTLANNKLYYSGEVMGGVVVQLTDAFFADPKSLKNTYVIPLVMTKATGADSILVGSPLIEGDKPARTNSDYWNVLPKDYVLYCVKYINKYHANYLRRGVDQITENGVTSTNVRHQQYVEKDEVCSTTTRSLNSVVFPVSTNLSDGNKVTCNLILTFNDKGECTIASDSQEYKASGTGKYLDKSEKKAWGNKDRDGLYLEYQIDFGTKKYATKDTLVWQGRGLSRELFNPKFKIN